MTGPSIVFSKPSYAVDEEIKLEVLPGDEHPMVTEVVFNGSLTYASGATATVTAPATVTGSVHDVEAFGYDVTPDTTQPEGFHYIADPA